jgi:hypothetical protein
MLSILSLFFRTMELKYFINLKLYMLRHIRINCDYNSFESEFESESLWEWYVYWKFERILIF